jgi:hypothetical protein
MKIFKVLILGFIFAAGIHYLLVIPLYHDYTSGRPVVNNTEFNIYRPLDKKTSSWSKAIMFHNSNKVKYKLKDGTILRYFQG